MLVSRRKNAICSAEPAQLEGAAGAWVNFVRKTLSYLDVFPPISAGAGAGIGIGCGLGWNIRALYGPPRAFCGAGIGVMGGIGYLQGFVRRFGKDNRNDESMERIRNIEKTLENFGAALSTKLKAIIPGQNTAPRLETFNSTSRHRNSSPVSFVVPLTRNHRAPSSTSLLLPLQPISITRKSIVPNSR